MAVEFKTISGCLLVISLAACSSSTGTTGNGVNQGSELNSPDEMAQTGPPVSVSGLIMIQENKGKRTFDAFFTGEQRVNSPRIQLWQEGDQICFGSGDSDDVDTDQALSSVMDATVYAGASINIQGRSGRYISLDPQVLGSTVVYASDERWTDSEMPQDAVLSVSGSDWFPEESGIALYPLQPIEGLEPENGVLLREASSVRWDSTDDVIDWIQLVLTVPYDSSAFTGSVTATTTRVLCYVPDSGSFDIPDSVRDSMGNPDLLYMSLSRRRTSEIAHEGSLLSVLQISNGQ